MIRYYTIQIFEYWFISDYSFKLSGIRISIRVFEYSHIRTNISQVSNIYDAIKPVDLFTTRGIDDVLWRYFLADYSTQIKRTIPRRGSAQNEVKRHRLQFDRKCFRCLRLAVLTKDLLYRRREIRRLISVFIIRIIIRSYIYVKCNRNVHELDFDL